jgi:hypothetical protein
VCSCFLLSPLVVGASCQKGCPKAGESSGVYLLNTREKGGQQQPKRCMPRAGVGAELVTLVSVGQFDGGDWGVSRLKQMRNEHIVQRAGEAYAVIWNTDSVLAFRLGAASCSAYPG